MADTRQEDVAADIIRHYESATGERSNWESHWEEVAQRVLPHYAGSFTNKDGRQQGEKRTEEMVDPTAALALPKFAAAMESMLTPRGSTWHRLQPPDKMVLKNRVARMWYDDLNEVLFRRRYAPNANFASQQHEIYMGVGAFGTAPMFVDKLDMPGGGLRYRAVHLGEVYFVENHQGIIDTAFRKFELTARQAVQKWPTGLPEKIVTAAKDPAKCETKFWFIHCVRPRKEYPGYDRQRKDVKGMTFASHYVAVADKVCVGNEGGYNTFPYPVSRYVIAPGETYGRSPAMLALPAIKVLNEEKKTVLKQGHRVVDPVLLAHDDGVLDSVSLKPGFVNYGGVSAEGRALIHALPVGNLSLAKEMMESERMVINDAFLVTLFQILIETPAMTATEVLERAREKGALLSPTMGRQHSEYFGPLIDRELDVLSEQRLLPPMPQIVKDMGADYDVIYDSPLSRAQRAEQATGLMRLVAWAQEYVGVTGDPSPLDHIDFDGAMPDLADIQAVPAKWVASEEKVAAKRAARAEAQQSQQMVDAAPALSGLMKSMPKQGAPAR